MKDIELRYQGMAVAVMRELAGIRPGGVPSNRKFHTRIDPPCPAEEQNELRDRIRELAVAIAKGPKLPPSKASVAASRRTRS